MPEADHGFDYSWTEFNITYCYVSKKKRIHQITKEGTRCILKTLYFFKIDEGIPAHNIEEFYLTEQEYFQYKLNGFFDDYEMRYMWEFRTGD